MDTFAGDGHDREPVGRCHPHRGLRSFFTRCFGAGGGIGLQHCAVTDDVVRCAAKYNCVRCAAKYNCVRWGAHELAPHAGMTVIERARTGC